MSNGAVAVAQRPKRYSPMAYNKATVRRRITDTTNRFKRARVEEIEQQLDLCLKNMWTEGLLPFSKFDMRPMKFKVEYEGNDGFVVYLPERLKKWLNEV